MMSSRYFGKKNYLFLPVFAVIVLALSQVSSHDAYAIPVWSASGPGTVATTIPDQGINGTAQFTYFIDLGNGGVPTQTWTFETTATQTGPITLHYNWHGFHAFFQVTTFLNKVDSAGTTNLISQGPVDCCTSPSAGFNYTGSVTFNAVAGQKYGFTLGGSNFDSNSKLLGTFTVYKQATTTAVSSSANPSIFGQPVTFTADVSPNTAAGNVTFSIDGTPQAPVALSGGTAALTTSSLSVGNHTVTAAYSGDSGDESSTSNALTQTVKPVPFSSLGAKVHIEDNYTHFELRSNFTLGASSPGINPVTDNVSLQVGTFSMTIPAGSFKHDDRHYKFEGVINGVHVEAGIMSRGSNTYDLKVEAEHANMTGTVNPVTVQVTIGDNSGSTEVNAKIDVDHDGESDHHVSHDDISGHHDSK